jgi:hypothetical protein
MALMRSTPAMPKVPRAAPVKASKLPVQKAAKFKPLKLPKPLKGTALKPPKL